MSFTNILDDNTYLCTKCGIKFIIGIIGKNALCINCMREELPDSVEEEKTRTAKRANSL